MISCYFLMIQLVAYSLCIRKTYEINQQKKEIAQLEQRIQEAEKELATVQSMEHAHTYAKKRLGMLPLGFHHTKIVDCDVFDFRKT